jgi:hypothetical protein
LLFYAVAVLFQAIAIMVVTGRDIVAYACFPTESKILISSLISHNTRFCAVW